MVVLESIMEPLGLYSFRSTSLWELVGSGHQIAALTCCVGVPTSMGMSAFCPVVTETAPHQDQPPAGICGTPEPCALPDARKLRFAPYRIMSAFTRPEETSNQSPTRAAAPATNGVA